QSTSALGEQPLGQKPSLAPQLRAMVVHLKMHWAGSPDGVRMVSLSLVQLDCWPVQAETGSQVSPASSTPLPHLAAQSLSLVLLQVLGQQPSLFAQAVWTRSFTHSAVQLLPFTSFLSWQPLAGQLVG